MVHLPTSRPDSAPAFPPARQIAVTRDGLAALGGDLGPATLVEAYRKGLFPWEDIDPVPWFSPDPRCLLEPRDFHASRSLRKLRRQQRYRVTIDLRFPEVMRGCAGARRPGQRGTWIGERMIAAYSALHEQGIAHSVEVWHGEQLAGGLYGLALGRAFFGESMFSDRPNASKLALWALCRQLDDWGFHFVDCQQQTPHLSRLGARSVCRSDYLDRLERALDHALGWNPHGLSLIGL
ncbi:MAG: leucyl/phenylalanyl-tRNA--protein transferase [Deltaproteobacteria bacterium]|nr:MAG: leucyl/phenylalanyl-tRNA--protein transferase [Deltaproteobacteria bacterium]